MSRYFNKIFCIFISLIFIIGFYGAINMANSAGMNTSVTITVCGNDILESGEGCDDGNITPGDGCSSSCQIEGSDCGDDIIEDAEQCDGSNLNSETCLSRGYASGTLSCNANCTFNTSGCQSGGGGGGGGYVPPTATKVILQGLAYPNALITILEDGKEVTSIQADSQANFKVELTNVTAGVYTFGLWAEDKNSLKSVVFNFTTSVAKNTITTISGIFLPPTIDLHTTSLLAGDILKVSGQTAPASQITIYVSSTNELVKEIAADNEGSWNHDLDTGDLETGGHAIRAKSTSFDGLISTFSKTLAFNINGEADFKFNPADLNKDGRVDLIDFSILLYWWGKDSETADINNDSIVDLIDFSILMYYWTG